MKEFNGWTCCRSWPAVCSQEILAKSLRSRNASCSCDPRPTQSPLCSLLPPISLLPFCRIHLLMIPEAGERMPLLFWLVFFLFNLKMIEFRYSIRKLWNNMSKNIILKPILFNFLTSRWIFFIFSKLKKKRCKNQNMKSFVWKLQIYIFSGESRDSHRDEHCVSSGPSAGEARIPRRGGLLFSRRRSLSWNRSLQACTEWVCHFLPHIKHTSF